MKYVIISLMCLITFNASAEPLKINKVIKSTIDNLSIEDLCSNIQDKHFTNEKSICAEYHEDHKDMCLEWTEKVNKENFIKALKNKGKTIKDCPKEVPYWPEPNHESETLSELLGLCDINDFKGKKYQIFNVDCLVRNREIISDKISEIQTLLEKQEINSKELFTSWRSSIFKRCDAIHSCRGGYAGCTDIHISCRNARRLQFLKAFARLSVNAEYNEFSNICNAKNR